MPRRLRVEFRTEEDFRREYVDNISNGGIFIASRETFDVREVVVVELVLSAAGETIELEGEAVHCIPPELAATGAAPGVAIHFLLDAEALRDRLGKFAPGSVGALDEQGFGAGRRAAPRSPVRVLAQVGVDGQWVDGKTRNISAGGVLIRLAGDPLPIGRNVKVCLTHPVSQRELEVEGIVRRHVEGAGETCMGIQFRIPEQRLSDFDGFLAELRSIEQTRRLGGISGPITDLGMERLVRMFGTTAPVGTLTVTRLEEEGVIVIDHGDLHARLGAKTGSEAFTALLGWRDGNFTFEARIEPGQAVGDALSLAELFGGAGETGAAEWESDGAPLPGLGSADFDALDSSELELLDVVEPPAGADSADASAISASKLAFDRSPFADDATLALTELSADDHADDLSKTDRALLDLAAVGVKVGKAVEIIPEPAADVYAALSGLIATGLVRVR